MARDKILRWARLYAGGYDLSGDALTFNEALNNYGEVDMTAWSDAMFSFVTSDRLQVGITGFQCLLNDDADRAFGILKDASQSLNTCLALGSGAEPAAGDPVYQLPAVSFNDIANIDNMKLTVGPVDLMPEAGSVGANYLTPWGIVLQPATSISSTTTGASQDNGASSSDGYHAMLQVLATASGNYSIVIEHSTDNSNWSTLDTFSADGSAITSEFISGSGTVNQYVRAVLTRTAGTITALVTFARN